MTLNVTLTRSGRGLAVVSNAHALGASSIEVSISKLRGANRFLQAKGDGCSGWGEEQAWFAPQGLRLVDDALHFELDKPVGDVLDSHVSYWLELRSGSPTGIVREPLRWPNQPSEVEDPPTTPPPTTPAPITPPPITPTPTVIGDVVVTEAPPGPEKRPDPPLSPFKIFLKRRWPILVGVLAVVLLLFAAIEAYPVIGGKLFPPEPALTVEGATQFVRSHPTLDGLLEQGQRFLKAGTPESLQGSLLIYSAAATAGNPAAEVAMGMMYDPQFFSPQTSAHDAADADKAALWYSQAAEQNDADGLYHLGHLLVSGATTVTGEGPEDGMKYLQRASDLGSKAAKQELVKLKEPQR